MRQFLNRLLLRLQKLRLWQAAILDEAVCRESSLARRRHNSSARIAEDVDIRVGYEMGLRNHLIRAQQIGSSARMNVQHQDHRNWLRARVHQFVANADFHTTYPDATRGHVPKCCRPFSCNSRALKQNPPVDQACIPLPFMTCAREHSRRNSLRPRVGAVRMNAASLDYSVLSQPDENLPLHSLPKSGFLRERALPELWPFARLPAGFGIHGCAQRASRRLVAGRTRRG